MTWLWLIPASAFIAAVAMLWLGLRGRRVNDHPICRRCGFDLFNRPETSARCPECGADLDKPRAIRIGRRERRGFFVATGGTLLAIVLTLGGTLLVVTLAVGGAAGYAAFTITDWQPHKPAWWLVRELNDPRVRNAAVSELSARLGAGKLAPHQVNAAVDKALSIQADAAEAWNPSLGDFIEDARRAKRLDDPRWERFARQTPRHILRVRRRVRHGDPIPYAIYDGSARVGNRTQFHAAWRRLTASMAGGPILDSRRTGAAMPLNLTGSNTAGDAVEAAEYADRVAPGTHTLVIDLEVDVQHGGQHVEDLSIATTTLRLTAPFELLPASSPSVAVIEDESIRAAMERAIVGQTSASVNAMLGPRRVEVVLNCHGAPRGIGYQVYAIVDGHEQQVRFIACEGGTSNRWHMSFDMPDNMKTVDAIDLLYKPSVEAAARTTDVFEIWGGTILHERIPVTPGVSTPPPPPPRPPPAPRMPRRPTR